MQATPNSNPVTDADIEAHTDLMRKTARRFHRRLPRHGTVRLDDLLSECRTALWDSLLRYDPVSHPGMGFTQYAIFRMKSAMVDFMRAQTSLSRTKVALRRRIQDERGRLATALGHTPTAAEIASAIGIAPAAYHLLLAEFVRSSASSLDDTLRSRDGTALTVRDTLRDSAAEPERAVLADEARGTLRAAVKDLPIRQRFIIAMRYYADAPMERIAECLGVSPSRVSQLHTDALRSMKVALRPRLADISPHIAA